MFTVFTLRLLEAKENMIMAMSVLDDDGHTGRHLIYTHVTHVLQLVRGLSESLSWFLC